MPSAGHIVVLVLVLALRCSNSTVLHVLSCTLPLSDSQQLQGPRSSRASLFHTQTIQSCSLPLVYESEKDNKLPWRRSLAQLFSSFEMMTATKQSSHVPSPEK
ncbi:hypothetical protein CGMCC3_g3417 [Colletotrichum fructicola]|nr:uncharacterized protein CGMCC3_g3417 [Colletotrichum fructicola]KAE9580420.1 hypothetical protein CGMCC3_g3417 [Colletotrichum fructicola]